MIATTGFLTALECINSFSAGARPGTSCQRRLFATETQCLELVLTSVDRRDNNASPQNSAGATFNS